MDGVGVIHRLGRIAHALNRVGLRPVTGRVAGLFAGQALEAEVEGFQLRGSFSHRAYLAEMRAGRRESFMTELFSAAVQEGDVVVDVGACLGLFSLIAARESGERGRVIAFEAHPETFELLVHNARANGLSERIDALERAAADRPGTVSFHLDDATASSSGMFAGPESSRSVTVATCTVDDTISDASRVGTVKIDAEGGEVEVLHGMRRTVMDAPARLRLFVECNPPLLERAGHSTAALLSELAGLGLTAQLIDERRRTLEPFAGDLGAEPYVNLLCRHAEP